MEGGLVSHGKLVRSYGQTSPLLEPVDARFNGVPLLVGHLNRLPMSKSENAAAAATLCSVLDHRGADLRHNHGVICLTNMHSLLKVAARNEAPRTNCPDATRMYCDSG